MAAVLPIVFIAGVLIGLGMAVAHFRGKTSPQAIGYLHGAFTLLGVLLFLALLLRGDEPTGNGWLILGLFVLAALGGVFLHYRKHHGKPWPALVILAHGGIGLTAVVLLTLWLLASA